MQIYAADPVRRTRQLVVDVVTFVVIVVAILLGRAVGASIAALGAVGTRMADAGTGFQSTMANAADRLSALPVGGHALGSPFRKASEAASTLVSAGQDQRVAAEHTALLVGLVVAVLPSLAVLVLWIRRRGGFVRRAGAVRALLAGPLGVEALAAQALSHARPRDLRGLDASVVERWRRGEPAAVRELASVAVRRAGVPERLLRVA